MYEKWLAEDSKSLEDNKNAIRELKKQIEAVKASQDLHEQKLNEKADALGTKEDILMVRWRAQTGTDVTVFGRISTPSSSRRTC